MECLVFTNFWPTQPGFLIYKYRVQSIINNFSAVIVSNIKEAKDILAIPDANFLHLSSQKNSVYNDVKQLIKMQNLIKEISPRCVVYLHSKFAPYVNFIDSNSILFWNEHPSHWCSYKASNIFSKKFIKNYLYHNLSYSGARKSKYVMPISEAQEKDLYNHGCSKSNVKMIYLGVDKKFIPTEDFLQRKILNNEDNPINIVYTGAVKSFRGRDIMLEALCFVNSPDIKFTLNIVGPSGKDLSDLKEKAHMYSCKEWLKITERVRGEEIPNLLHKADIGISLLEPKEYWKFNPVTKIFEYMAAGLPVIANHIEAHSTYLENWSNSILVDYSVESLIHALEALWSRRGELPKMWGASLKEGKKYLWQSLERNFLNLIEEAIK